jgi:predicted nucleotidyltransferase
VRDIIDAVIPGAAVSVFGSRSTGRARPYSDLDLLFTRPAVSVQSVHLAWC